MFSRKLDSRHVLIPYPIIKNGSILRGITCFHDPSYVVLHVSTNDCVETHHDVVVNELIHLRNYIEEQTVKSLSEPIMRMDKQIAAQNEVCKILRFLDIDILNNLNIMGKHLGKAALE